MEYQLTLRFMCFVRSLSAPLNFVSNVGKTQIPNSSLFSLGVLYFSTVAEPNRKQSSVKCFEHTTDERVGVHLSLPSNEVDPFLPSFSRYRRVIIPKRYLVYKYIIASICSARTPTNDTSSGYFSTETFKIGLFSYTKA